MNFGESAVDAYDEALGVLPTCRTPAEMACVAPARPDRSPTAWCIVDDA
jgi:hypothetical protein